MQRKDGEGLPVEVREKGRYAGRIAGLDSGLNAAGRAGWDRGAEREKKCLKERLTRSINHIQNAILSIDYI